MVCRRIQSIMGFIHEATPDEWCVIGVHDLDYRKLVKSSGIYSEEKEFCIGGRC